MATLASPSLAGSSHTSLSMLPNSTLALAQQQAAYNSLFSLGSSSSGSLSSQSQPQLQSQAQTQHQSRTDTPPVPVSTYANLPSSSLLATSLYPLLTLGIAGGAVSGELGAAAWNAYQQSQLAQAQAQAGNSHMSLPQNLHQHHSQPSFLSQSQPMSTLSSERLDSPSGLQNPLESLRTSSPRYSAGSSPASFAAPAPGSSSPRFDPGSFDTRFEPSGSRFDAPARFDSQLDSQHLQFGQNTSSGSASANDSPHFATPAPARTTPTGYGSSAASTPPGSGQNGRRGSSSNASQRDGL